MAASPPNFLPHANGLRALAITAIFFYHLQNEFCPCGYFGVDLFLILSGYFLARNDLVRLRAGSVGYGGYLLRKAWRIMPPWVAIALPVCLLAAFIMCHQRGAIICLTTGSSALCAGNEYIALSGNYFNPNTQENPLLHLWYIGLTVQLYLLAPFFGSYLVCRLRRVWTLAALATAGMLSLGLYCFLAFGEQSPALMPWVAKLNFIHPYYSVLCRLWEPMLGAALATLPLPRPRAWHPFAAAAGLALFAFSIYHYPTGSYFVFPAVAGSLLMLAFGGAGWMGRLLSLRPLQATGAISFSLYLCHWPVFVFWKYATFNEPGIWGQVGMGLLAVLLALPLWRFVETRCTRWGRDWAPRRRAKVTLWSMGSLGLGGLALGLIPQVASIWPARIDEAVLNFQHRIPDDATEADLRGLERGAFAWTPATVGNRRELPAEFLLLGDSHSWHLVEGMTRACDARGDLRGVYLNNSCVPLWDYFLLLNSGNARWDEARARALVAWMEAQPGIRYVIVSDYWLIRLHDTDSRDWNYRLIPAEELEEHMLRGFQEMARRLRAAGKELVLLHDTPRFLGRDPVDEYQRCFFLGKPLPERHSSRGQYAQDNERAERMFARLEAEGLARVIHTAEALEFEGKYPLRSPDGKFLYRDGNHLSAHGSRLVAELLLRRLWPAETKRAEGETSAPK